MSSRLLSIPDDPVTVAFELQSLFQCLSRLKLQRLDIHMNGSALHWSLPGMHAIDVQRLTHLTALHVYGWTNFLDQAHDCEALAGLQQLQSLCLPGFEPEVQPKLVSALGALPSLTQLLLQPQRLREELCDEGLQDPNHSPQAAFEQYAPRAAWPKLRWLGMAVTNEGEVINILGAVKRFPRLETVALGLDDHEWQPTPPDPSAEELDVCSSDKGVRVICKLDRERFAWRSAVA